MAWTNPSTPNLTDFYTYVTGQGVPTADLPSDSVWLQYAFNWAMDHTMSGAPIPGYEYTRAVYNAGMDRLLWIAEDLAGQTFFTQQRATYGILQFKPGVVMASGDNSTSQTLVVPDYYKELPMWGQELLKTPWGREYLAYAQMYGPYVVGVS